ncbi:MAG: response regulator [Methylovulum sp.]|nr:response regulator [Methylovulum sp.]
MTISKQKHAQKRHLLLVDDNRLFLATMMNALTLAGYDVDTAESVSKAEVWLESNPRPDLVLLDVNMPERNGLELVERLNASNHIPFILLTAYSEDDIIEQANRLSASSYLVKPVDTVQIIPAVEVAISRANEIHTLQDSKQKMQTVLDSNRELNIAIGITMMRFNRNREQAFELMRSVARSQNRKLTAAALELIQESEAEILKNSQ